MARAAFAGASEIPAEDGSGYAGAILLPAATATPDHLLAAGAYLFVGPENLGGLSGVMKDMLDRCYYPMLGRVEGRGFASIIAAGSSGTGAEAQLERILTGWRLRRIADRMIVNFLADTPEAILAQKVVPKECLARCHELGKAIALGMTLGIF